VLHEGHLLPFPTVEAAYDFYESTMANVPVKSLKVVGRTAGFELRPTQIV